MSIENASAELIRQAEHIIDQNDRGTYTVPTHGLYPFQWNWDSCLTALGQSHKDEGRAWLEIQTLFNHQWDDGMVPHIIFHELDDGYFPGPDVWGTQKRISGSVPTSGITQPPVAGFAAKKLYESAKNKVIAEQSARSLLGKIDQWHEWFYAARDPQSTGLVALLHPWESGRDNSIDWDDAFARVPTDGIAPYERRDTQHADPTHRPTREQYDRYLWLVEHFRSLNWDMHKLHDSSPFQVIDPGFNAILIRSCIDLAWLANELDEHDIANKNQQRAQRAIEAMESLWSDRHSQYLCLDRRTGALVENPSVGGIIPVLAPLPEHRLQTIADRIKAIEKRCKFLVPSQDPAHPEFDAKRYWRGPSWLIVNFLIADGLYQADLDDVAKKIEQSSLALIEQSGFAEYYDPIDGTPCGGTSFTWTAAMVIHVLKSQH